ncbi:ABC transporter permease [Methanosphaera sp. Vir-13MRS]|uniref:ABC transporter permease n=1 Tax=Candidatus Methanosphaera massiliense TaxID=3017187 RepID=UPI00238060FC|nr:ABC transporter permease [Candidatus Methanosphaera massiliense]MDE4078161.1 ABC transporter permease [Candidatus Methanosphaera massiliense]
MEINKIKWMIKKDFLTLWRHKVQLASLFIFPILMIALCGWGMGGTVDNTPVIIVKQSDGPITDETINALKSDDTYDIKDIVTDPDDAKDDVDDGKYKAAIILSSDFEDSNSRSAVLYVDSSDQQTTASLVPTTEKIFSSLSEKIQTEQVNANTSTNAIAYSTQAIKLQVNKIYGDLDYIDYLLPGVLAMTMFMSSMMTMGNSIAGERERGELARLFMTPTSVSTVLAGKISSQVLRQMIQAIILLIAGSLLFSIMIKGNILLLLLIMLICVLCFVGFGIMFSATAKTQEDYIQIVMPIAMPMMFISGVFFPTETMPWVLQKIAYILPLTYANDAIRAVMLKGAGLGSVSVDIIVLLAFALLFFIVGVLRFNRDI